MKINLLAAGLILSAHVTILALGDSITQGSGNCTSYTYPLSKMLKTEGFDFEFLGPRTRTYEDVGVIHHCGYGGKTVEYFIPVIDSLYQVYPADVVLIHSGHNHFVEQHPIPGIIKSHRALIDRLREMNPDVTIIVAQVIPSGKLPKYSYIPELNRELKEMVRSYHSPHVLTVNLERGFDWKTMTADDKVHPNPKGADFMAKRWIRPLRRVMRRLNRLES